jgi:hypothetical protein
MESLAADQDPVGAEDAGRQVADLVELAEVIPLAEARFQEPLREAAPAGLPAARPAVADEGVRSSITLAYRASV